MDLSHTDAERFLVKREVLDLLSIRDPGSISSPEREGDIGLGDPFSFPFQTLESIFPLGDGQLLLLNDNNYPLSAGRNPDEPDDTEAIIVRSDALLDSSPARQMPGTGGHPLLVPFGSALLVAGVLGVIVIRRVRLKSRT